MDSSTLRSDQRLVLPRWQPDHNVVNCPICHIQFSFWYRKHHCRRCGRVVCAFCSPHRITIPKSFVVRPPHRIPGCPDPEDLNLGNDRGSVSLPATARRMRSHRSSSSVTMILSAEGIPVDPDLSGGEEVRICNPCVPDPKVEPPPQSNRHGYTADHASQRNRDAYVIDRVDADSGASLERVSRLGYLGNWGNRRSTVGSEVSNRTRSDNSQRRSQGYALNSDLAFENSTRPALEGHNRPFSHRQTVSDTSSHFSPHNSHYQSRTSRRPGDTLRANSGRLPPNLGNQRFPQSMVTGPRTGLRRRNDSISNTSSPSPVGAASTMSGHGPSLTEEFPLCPVCQARLPSRGLDGNTSAQEEHIISCIAGFSTSYSSSRSRHVVTPAAPSSPQTSSRSRVAPLPAVPIASSSSSSSSSSPPHPTSSAGLIAARPSNISDRHAGRGVSSHGQGFPLRSSSLSTGSSLSVSSAQQSQSRRHTLTAAATVQQFYPRMITYLATEKDCQPPPAEDKDDNSTSAECVICFEDFEPGVLLARLECLCKFHDDCLKRWWQAKASSIASLPTAAGLGHGAETAGGGFSCPVHYQGGF